MLKLRCEIIFPFFLTAQIVFAKSMHPRVSVGAVCLRVLR